MSNNKNSKRYQDKRQVTDIDINKKRKKRKKTEKGKKKWKE